ncbi:hypothetical protein BLNAU_6397 [Blattamonas nauphoetae]|uniref:Uncharacterized protein n=1 Tax=Blattamonas nauphoetae TaxID=2049346 RepID=A0ABQ9Y4K6_9EUKA|nr:hypothetical protein BLNAU_6397 [Blattamonas nauphoetae]
MIKRPNRSNHSHYSIVFSIFLHLFLPPPPPLAAHEERALPSSLSTLSLLLLLQVPSPQDAHTKTQPSLHTSTPSPPIRRAAIGTPHNYLPCSQTTRPRPTLPSPPPTPATPYHSPPLPFPAPSLPSSLPPLRTCLPNATIHSSLPPPHPPSTRPALACSLLPIRSRMVSITADLSRQSQPRSIPSRHHPVSILFLPLPPLPNFF